MYKRQTLKKQNQKEQVIIDKQEVVEAIPSEKSKISDKKKKKRIKYRAAKKKKILVKKLDSSITAKIKIQGMLPFSIDNNIMDMSTDTGV